MDHFFTADTHFGHANIIKYCNRPFASLEEHDEALIENWNRLVKPSDHVYHLGDFSYRADASLYRKRLNGHITLIKGNHDKSTLAKSGLFSEVADLKMVVIDDIEIVLCHYALRVWNKSHFNSYHLYGHSHGHLAPQGKSMDVGVDTQLAAFAPIPFETIRLVLAGFPDNFNWIPPRETPEPQ